jgi:putative addiction module component (TIGR02574 family)
MGNQLEILEAEALKLSPSERAVFAKHLLASLDEDESIQDAWAIEVERRVTEIESGKLPLITLDTAIAQVRASLQ